MLKNRKMSISPMKMQYQNMRDQHHSRPIVTSIVDIARSSTCSIHHTSSTVLHKEDPQESSRANQIILCENASRTYGARVNSTTQQPPSQPRDTRCTPATIPGTRRLMQASCLAYGFCSAISSFHSWDLDKTCRCEVAPVSHVPTSLRSSCVTQMRLFSRWNAV